MDPPDVAGLGVCPGGAAAQTTTATLQRMVRDATGAVLQGVTITVRSPDTGVTRVTVTDAMRDSGSYFPLAAGTLGDLPRNAGRGPGL